MKRDLWPISLKYLLLPVLVASCRPAERQHAATWMLAPFVKVDSVNPILSAGPGRFFCPVRKDTVRWEEKDVFNPAAVVRHGKVYLLYRAEDRLGRHAGTSRIGLAESQDGLHFARLPKPVLYPDNDSLKYYEWEGGIEDPRVVESPEGLYIMTYTAYDGQTARLMVASSSDLLTWQKHGPALQGPYRKVWSKSGAIVAELQGDRVVAKKINNRYWMYFGDTNVFIATSANLLQWEPVAEGDQLKAVLKPRPGYFDSRLVEPGPFALVRPQGIVLLYNAMNLEKGGDPNLPPGTYAAGQALFSASQPTLLLNRSDQPFMVPERPYEITGQVNKVCFIEGLVYFKNKWLLYYGTADSHIAVAIHLAQ
ncbi:MAG: hypothetical protein KatS3mg032_1377 [Cyclobacteriaceae bacterium]|nr:MAG: hypothetical protein KatS3mg032_1377 [Cyclobacteriaceae bacterium]